MKINYDAAYLRIGLVGDSITAEWTLQNSASFEAPEGGKGASLRMLKSAFKKLLNEVERGDGLEALPLGRKLWDAVTTHTSPRAIAESIAESIRRESHGLRLILSLNEKLEQLPWELLATDGPDDENRLGFLGRHGNVSIVRSGKPDSDAPQLSGGSFHAAVARALKPKEETSTDIVQREHVDLLSELSEPIGWDSMVNAIPPTTTVFAFIGHGMLRPRKPPGIDLVKTYGGDSFLPADRLGGALAKIGAEVAIVAACGVGTDPRGTWSGMGSTLVGKGVAAVVSMQADLPITTGFTLTQALLDDLAEGTSVDQALGRFRSAKSNESTWWIPVLHSRAGESVALLPPPAERPGEPASVDSDGRIILEGAGDLIPRVFADLAEFRASEPENPAPRKSGFAQFIPSTDGVGVACEADGSLWLGLWAGANASRAWRWSASMELGPGEGVRGVHFSALNSQVLVDGPDGSRVVCVDPRGQSWSRIVGVRTESAAWTGRGFSWVAEDGTLQTEDPDLPRQLRKAKHLERIDALTIGAVRWIATWGSQELAVYRLTSGNDLERRIMQVGEKPERLIIARPAESAEQLWRHLEESAFERDCGVFLAIDGDLVGWRWTDFNQR